MTTALMAASLALSATEAGIAAHQQDKALDKQNKAQMAAQEKQDQADYDAEKARLEALAKNQEATNEFDFGVDSALAKRYRDAAQKWGAGTGEMTQKEEEENPFYTRGLF